MQITSVCGSPPPTVSMTSSTGAHSIRVRGKGLRDFKVYIAKDGGGVEVGCPFSWLFTRRMIWGNVHTRVYVCALQARVWFCKKENSCSCISESGRVFLF